jgi:hypothetical protein
LQLKNQNQILTTLAFHFNLPIPQPLKEGMTKEKRRKISTEIGIVAFDFING